ncbi:hypothetical protein [Aphanothece minutissima]|uniref:LysR family transcriptional regulator n=1 Tax=Aphanothece cf. minutissima CCALA 015 TaxID=2107695 RepID=A0ABX5F9K6_9CHRO|nr:hypothetical protein [Aphanothece minutissima]PSB38489.1 hypothetical protein C7B81_02605 [Aphanothece cf. minutissima CCALA 015]
MLPSATPLSRVASPYRPPMPLEDLHILDYLELAGSQARAGAALAMHQSTVSRSLRLMQQQFRLVPERGSPVCRHGHNPCLHHLRLASREHRLMEGLLRIGTDVLHQSLLAGLAGVQPVPPRCRSGDHWAGLVGHGLLDGAIVSAFSLPQPLPPGEVPRWDGLRALPLGRLNLQLVAAAPGARRVLLPPRGAAPLLHQAVTARGFAVEPQPAACQEPAAWVKRALDRGLALPLCPALLGPGWLADNGLETLAEPSPLVDQLWLLLPEVAVNTNPARQCLRRLRMEIRSANVMQDRHGR